jgi:hypothetical protein
MALGSPLNARQWTKTTNLLTIPFLQQTIPLKPTALQLRSALFWDKTREDGIDTSQNVSKQLPHDAA